MDKTYKITFNRIHKFLLIPVSTIIILALLVTYGLGWILNPDGVTIFNWMIFLATLLVPSIFSLIPLTVLTYLYTSKEMESILKVQMTNDLLIYKTRNEKFETKISEIDKIVLVSNSRFKRSPGSTIFWDHLFYYEIIANNKILNVSCFMIDSLKGIVPVNLYEERTHFLPFFKYSISEVNKTIRINSGDEKIKERTLGNNGYKQ